VVHHKKPPLEKEKAARLQRQLTNTIEKRRITEDKVDKSYVMKNEKAYLKKFVYNEIDEEELYIKEKVKAKKQTKPKKKDSKPLKGKKSFSEDWD
jgi:flagellar biosynthesis protein FliP